MFEKLSQNVSEIIREEVSIIREKYHIDNLIIRNDILDLLEELCTVLQYPLENDEDANGLHVQRWVNGEKKHFVFINSSNPLEKQVYTAAHELGHVWEIDEKVAKKCEEELDPEAIINRFAAELLMPREVFFKKVVMYCVQEHIVSDGRIKENDMLTMLVCMMNEFMVPYKAVVYRMEELEIINEVTRKRLEELEKKSDERLSQLIQKGNYLNLNQVKYQKAMGNIEKMLIMAEEQEIYSEKKINNIRTKFELERPEKNSESMEISLEEVTEG